jgi:hypothetical protein
MSKYDVPDGHWEKEEDDSPPRWVEETSATLEVEVYIHKQGYQNDRRWRVTFGTSSNPPEDFTALYAIEDRNKGNYWRRRDFDHAIDFVDVPLRARKRVAALLNRDLGDITPEHRLMDDAEIDREPDQ